MENTFVWIGPRDSDIHNDSFFDTSITTYGGNNYAYCQYSKKRYSRGSSDEIYFIENSIQNLNLMNPYFQYMFYDQSEIVNINSQYKSQIICANDPFLVNILNSKEFTRSWLSNSMNCLPFIVLPFSDINYNNICRLFPGVSSFIIQNIYGVGGTKTHIVTNSIELDVIKTKYKPFEVSIISPYINNAISFNVHILCDKDKGIVFPYSAQIINQLNHCLLYVGSDFTYKCKSYINSQIYEAANLIVKKLLTLGYIGIAGIDFLLANDTLYFVEINPRFQGSTRILNLWLTQHNYQSIYQMNFDAFAGKSHNYNFQNETIPYISHNYISGANNTFILPSNYKLIAQDIDGWNSETNCSENVYMYRNIYKVNQL